MQFYFIFNINFTILTFLFNFIQFSTASTCECHSDDPDRREIPLSAGETFYKKNLTLFSTKVLQQSWVF